MMLKRTPTGPMAACLAAVWLVLLGLALPAQANSDYERFCAGCHGRPGEPGMAPSLFGMGLSQADFMQVLRHGRNLMPSFLPEDISDSDAQRLHQYLRTSAVPSSTASSAAASSVASSRPSSASGANRPGARGVGGLGAPALPAAMVDELKRSDPFAPPRLYREKCQSCHGAIDSAPQALPLKDEMVIPDLRFMHLTSAQFARIVVEGHKLMPGFYSSMNASHTFPLYEWIRAQRPSAMPGKACRDQPIQASHRAWGRQLYSMYCLRCHGVDGQGSRESRGRQAVPPLGEPVAMGRILHVIRVGHSIAPMHLTLADSDRYQLAAYLNSLMGWKPLPTEKTPASFQELNGRDCQQHYCAALAQAADDKAAQNPATWEQPNAGTAECEPWQRKNKRKGPAGPGGQYPACWAQEEVDRFEQFCKEYRIGIARTYPQNRRVEAAPLAVTANTRLRSPWSQEAAVLSCQTGPALRYHLGQPNARNAWPNWRMRIYAPLIEKPGAKRQPTQGACWWENPEQGLGEGNPHTGAMANQITLWVRLPEQGPVPRSKFWQGRQGLEDEDRPLAEFSKTQRPFYEMLKVYRAGEGRFSLRVYRHLDNDKTRNPKACAACGNSLFSNLPWSIDTQSAANESP